MILATTGQIGSGKDAVVDILGKLLNAPEINISDIVRKEATANGISLERDPLTNWTEEMFMKHGSDYFVDKAIEEIKKVDSPIVVVSGIRSPRNVEVMKNEFGDNFKLIAVNTDVQTRFERIKKRGSEKDHVTYEEFLGDNAEQERIFQIGVAMKMADYQVDNNGDLENLEMQLKQLIEKFNNGSK